MNSVIILAAGASSRFNGQIKQLLPIPPTGEPIILRTIRYIKEIDPNHRITVFTHRADLANAVKGISSSILLPGPTDSILVTILLSAPMWGDRTTLLLGDVVYTRLALEKILSSEISFGMVANLVEKPHERLGLVFDGERGDDVITACKQALESGPLSGNPDVKLVNICANQIKNETVRNLVTRPRNRYLRPFLDYWMYHIQPVRGYPWYYLEPDRMIFLNDETQDIDSPAEYEAFIHRSQNRYSETYPSSKGRDR